VPAHLSPPPVRLLLSKVIIVTVPGEVTEATEDDLLDALSQASAIGARIIILDCSGLLHINSYGIGLLMMLFTQARRRGQWLSAYGLNERHEKVFALTRLSEGIPIFPCQSDALTAADSAKSARS